MSGAVIPMNTNSKKSLPRRRKLLRRLKAIALAAVGLGGASAFAQPAPGASQTTVLPAGSAVPIANTDLRAEVAYFLASGQHGRNGPESYVVPVNGAARIAEVRQYLAE